MRFPCPFAEWCDLLLALCLAALYLLLGGCGGASPPAAPAAPTALSADHGSRPAAPALPRFTRAPEGGSGAPAGPRALVLYDPGDPATPDAWGRGHAVLLANLLGHFNARVRLQAVSAYQAGQAQDFDALFYLGSRYDQPQRLRGHAAAEAAWQAFLADAARTTRPLVWINYHLWELDRWLRDHGQPDGLAARWGIAWQGIEDAGYNRVRYRGVLLDKGVTEAVSAPCDPEPDGGRRDCATELNRVRVVDDGRVRVHATALRAGAPDTEAPWALQSGHFWFIADLPFAYLSESDRYLAFADLLHDMLGIAHRDRPRQALLRLEDVSPATNAGRLRAMVDWLQARDLPFAVATIPVFADPQGVRAAPGGPAPATLLRDGPVGEILRQAARSGLAGIVQHGTSHQWDGGINPWDQVTGSDYEFFRVLPDGQGGQQVIGPLPEDSSEWARRRIRLGLEVLLADGLVPFAWEPPHYLASAVDHAAIRAAYYPVLYGRGNYFADPQQPRQPLGQFFPYPIERDQWGYRVVPENLGYVAADEADGGVSRLLRRAACLRVVRDGVASAFLHPRLGTDVLQRLVTGLQAQGYQFVAPCLLALHCPPQEPGDGGP